MLSTEFNLSPFAAKNGVYISLVDDVRHAFEGSILVKIDCTGMHESDYKKLGAKLKVGIHFHPSISALFFTHCLIYGDSWNVAC